MPAILVGIGSLTLALWVIATALAIADVMLYISGVLHGLPFPLNQLAGPVNSLARGISSVCGKLEGGVDHLVGLSWHWAARYMDKVWNTITTGESFNHASAVVAQAHAVAINQLAARWRAERSSVTAHESRVAVLEREFHGIDRQVKELEKEISKGIGVDVLPQIKSLDREVAKINTQTLPRAQSLAREAEHGVSNLWDWITRNVPLAGTATFAGVVAFALSNLGLGWLRCNSNPFNNNKNACGLWSILGRVLGLAAFLTVAFDFQEFVDASNEVASFIGTAVGDFEGSVPLSLPPLPPPQ